MEITPNKWRYLRLVAGIVALSFSPLAVKLVSFSPTVSAFYRSFYAGLFFLIASFFEQKRGAGIFAYQYRYASKSPDTRPVFEE